MKLEIRSCPILRRTMRNLYTWEANWLPWDGDEVLFLGHTRFGLDLVAYELKCTGGEFSLIEWASILACNVISWRAHGFRATCEHED
jgi:hypothetical protein